MKKVVVFLGTLWLYFIMFFIAALSVKTIYWAINDEWFIITVITAMCVFTLLVVSLVFWPVFEYLMLDISDYKLHDDIFRNGVIIQISGWLVFLDTLVLAKQHLALEVLLSI